MGPIDHATLTAINELAMNQRLGRTGPGLEELRDLLAPHPSADAARAFYHGVFPQ